MSRSYARTIYWRVTLPTAVHRPASAVPVHAGPDVRATGTFGDLKTLRGATRRLMRQFPSWREIEARHEPIAPERPAVN
jgi:hypothetical protein